MGWSWPTTLIAGATLALMFASSLTDRSDAREDLVALLRRLETQPPPLSPLSGHHRLAPLRATILSATAATATAATAATCYERAFAAQRTVPRFSITSLGHGRGAAGTILAPRLHELRHDLEPCFHWLRAGAASAAADGAEPPFRTATGELTRQLNERVIAEVTVRTAEGRHAAAVGLWLAGGQMLCDYHETFWLEERLLPYWSNQRLATLPRSELIDLHHGLARLEPPLAAPRPFAPFLARHVRELLRHSDARFEARPFAPAPPPWHAGFWYGHLGSSVRLPLHRDGLLELARLARMLQSDPRNGTTRTGTTDAVVHVSANTETRDRTERWRRFSSAPRSAVEVSSVANHVDTWFRAIEHRRRSALIQLQRLRANVAHRIGLAPPQAR